MKKSTKNVLGIIGGIAVATASAIFLGKNVKREQSEANDRDDNDDVDVADSEEATYEVED